MENYSYKHFQYDSQERRKKARQVNQSRKSTKKSSNKPKR